MSMTKNSSYIAIATIFIACLVLAFKFIAYYATQSIAFYSDALESVINIVTALVTLVTITISKTPPDHNHPFGHHKAEYFSAIFEGILITVAALLIIYSAVETLIRGHHHLSFSWYGLAFNALSTAINGVWSFFLISYGKRVQSPALTAEGKHILSDVYTSAGIFIAIIAVFITGWSLLDPLIALAIACHILWFGWTIIKDSVNALMDHAAPEETIQKIHHLICSHARGAIQYHDLKTRIAGPILFVELHLVVDRDMPVKEAHAIGDHVTDAIKKEFPKAYIVIHVDPDDQKEIHGINIPCSKG